MEKLNELVEALYPQYDAPGSRDVDVTARRKAIDESAAAIAEAFRALEQRAEDAEANNLLLKHRINEEQARSDAAEAKLAELEKQEAVVWCNENDLKLMVNKRMIGGMMTVRHHGERPLFTRPAPAINLAELVPKQVSIRQAIAALENHEYCDTPASGYKAGVKDTISAILRNIEETK